MSFNSSTTEGEINALISFSELLRNQACQKKALFLSPETVSLALAQVETAVAEQLRKYYSGGDLQKNEVLIHGLTIQVCAELVDVGISGVPQFRLPLEDKRLCLQLCKNSDTRPSSIVYKLVSCTSVLDLRKIARQLSQEVTFVVTN